MGAARYNICWVATTSGIARYEATAMTQARVIHVGV